MKNYIYENYGIKVKKIYTNYFFTGDDKVLIFKTNKEEDYLRKLVNLTNDLYNHNIMINTFIINNQGRFYTKKDDYYIVLLKVNDREKEIRYEDIKKFKSLYNDLDEVDFKMKFERGVDLFEEQIEDKIENKLIRDSYNYFIGLSENAIQLLNNYKGINNTLIHDLKTYNKAEFNNPFNLIKGNYTYDVANYIKNNFFENTLDYDELYNILIEVNDKNNQIFLFSCLLYADYYINNINDKIIIKQIINSIANYKELLSYCKKIYKDNEVIKSINWLF